MSEGIVVVISGPSGSGKGTVVEKLLEVYDGVEVSVSVTTRTPREGEVDGVSYFFKTKEEFLSLIENEEVLEYTVYNGNYYGTLKSEAKRIVSAGRDLILEIEVDGCGQVKRLMGDECVTVMLIAPNAAEQEKRLRARATESEEVIQARLERAKAEVAEATKYDYIVVNENGKIDECVSEILSIIKAEHLRYCRSEERIENYFN